MHTRHRSALFWIGLTMGTGLLVGCDISEIPGMGDQLSENESRAIGAGCRHSGRSLEECYAMNEKARRAGVFEGWRDMNDYMQANNIETVKPSLVSDGPKEGKEGSAKSEAAPDKPEVKPAKADGKPGSAKPADKSESKSDSKSDAKKADAKDVSEPKSGDKPKPWQRNKDHT